MLDQPHCEHEIIHDVIGSVDEALVRLATTPDDLTAVEVAVDTLAETLLSHFAYEERSLVAPLARHGFYPGQLDRRDISSRRPTVSTPPRAHSCARPWVVVRREATRVT